MFEDKIKKINLTKKNHFKKDKYNKVRKKTQDNTCYFKKT